jgi:hypothetical protein
VIVADRILARFFGSAFRPAASLEPILCRREQPDGNPSTSSVTAISPPYGSVWRNAQLAAELHRLPGFVLRLSCLAVTRPTALRVSKPSRQRPCTLMARADLEEK